MRSTKFKKISCTLLLFVISVFGYGCSSSNPAAPARISGKLTYKGAPIKAGSMKFLTLEGTAYDAQISSDGTYSATDLPIGEMVVIVETESVNPANDPSKTARTGEYQRYMKMMESRRPGESSSPGSSSAPSSVPKPTDNYIKIPEKYGKANTSPLTITLTKGRQVHDFDLTD